MSSCLAGATGEQLIIHGWDQASPVSPSKLVIGKSECFTKVSLIS